MKDRWAHCKPGESVEWPTPPALYELLHREFHFTLDPCPYGGTDDGLSTLFKPWRGERVFCNPPYGPGLRRWLRRGLDAELAVYLIPARTDTRLFHDEILPFASEIRFIRGRLRFGNAATSAPFASMIVIYRENETSLVTGPVISSMNAPDEKQNPNPPVFAPSQDSQATGPETLAAVGHQDGPAKGLAS